MELVWFNISMETPIRQVGWVWLTFSIIIGFLVNAHVKMWKEGYRFRIANPFNPCKHLRTRCIHGDEINFRIKTYVFRFWKPEEVRRQSCLDCNAALSRPAVCTILKTNQHQWRGEWPFKDDGDVQ